MSRLCWACAMALIAVACDKKPSAPPPTASPQDAATPVDAAAETKPPEPPAKPKAAEFPELTKDRVMVMAAKPGGKVSGVLQDKTTIEIADGTVADTKERWEDAPDETMVVDVGGKLAAVPTKHLVETLHVSPNKEFAIAEPEVSCNDFCWSEIWLLHGMSERTRLADSVAMPQLDWSPTGTELAVTGNNELLIVELPSGKIIKELDNYEGPSYAPDGTLHVRNMDTWHVFAIKDGKPKRVAKAKKPKLSADEEEAGGFIPRASPVEFAADGKMTIPQE